MTFRDSFSFLYVYMQLFVDFTFQVSVALPVFTEATDQAGNSIYVYITG